MLPYGDTDSDDDNDKNGLDNDGDFILKRTRKGFIEIGISLYRPVVNLFNAARYF